MATKLPGGRRRYNVKFSRKSVSRLNPYSKSPILNSPTKRSNFASGDRADEPVSPDDASGDEDSSAPFGSEDIRPEFLQGDATDETIQDVQESEVPEREARASTKDGNETASSSEEDALNDTDEETDGENNNPRYISGKGKSNKKKTAITLGILVLVVSVFGAVAFLPTLIIKQMTTKMTDAFMNRVNYALETRVETYVDKYVQNIIIPSKACGVKVDASCNSFPAGTVLTTKLYRSWKNGKIEDRLFNNHGLSFELDTRDKNKIKVFKTNSFGVKGEVGTYGRNTVGKEVVKIMKQDTEFDGVIKRRHLRSLLASKYKASKWCIIACAKKDEISDIKISALKKLEYKLINRVASPISSKSAVYLLCFATDCSPDKIEREASKAAQEIVEKAGKESVEKIAKDIEDLGASSMSDYIAKKMTAIILEKFFEYDAEAASKAAASSVPIVGQVYLAASVLDMIDQVDKKINKGVISGYAKQLREQALADYGQAWLVAGDDAISSESALEDKGAVVQKFFGYDKSRLWQSINNISPKSVNECEDGKILQGEDDPLVCPELTVNPGSFIEDGWKALKNYFPPLKLTLDIYNKCFLPIPYVGCTPGSKIQPIVHGALKGINWAISGIASTLLSFLQDIPIVGDGIDYITDQVGRIAIWAFENISKVVFTSSLDAAAGGYKLATQFGGSLDVISNSFAKGYKDPETGETVGLGGTVLSSAQQTQLDVEIAKNNAEMLKTESVFERYFSLNNTYSLATSGLMAIGESIPFQGESISIGLTNLGFIDTLSSLFGLHKKTSAFSDIDRSSLFDVTQYGFAVDDQALSVDPDTLTPERCSQYEHDRESSARTDSKTGEKIYTKSNPCLLDDVVVDSLTKIFDLDSSSAIGTGSGSNTVPTDLIAGVPLEPKNTDKIPCPQSPTIGFLRIEPEAYIKGTKYSITLCSVHGVEINSVVAKAYDDLFNAMEAAGYTFRGTYGFRDMASQIRGYAGGAGAGTYAKPGYSNHQYGAAVDISCQGGGKSYVAGNGRGRESFLSGVGQYPCLEWVAANSNKFGLLLQCVGSNSDGTEIRGGKDEGGCEWWHLSTTGG